MAMIVLLHLEGKRIHVFCAGHEIFYLSSTILNQTVVGVWTGRT